MPPKRQPRLTTATPPNSNRTVRSADAERDRQHSNQGVSLHEATSPQRRLPRRNPRRVEYSPQRSQSPDHPDRERNPRLQEDADDEDDGAADDDAMVYSDSPRKTATKARVAEEKQMISSQDRVRHTVRSISLTADIFSLHLCARNIY
jgi:hypothetical protein